MEDPRCWNEPASHAAMSCQRRQPEKTAGEHQNEEAPFRGRNLQNVVIENLQWQVAELTQHLAAQDFGDREMGSHDSDTSFENSYRNQPRFGEHRERIFEYKEVPDNVKVKLVAIKLKGRASAWWEQLRRSRDRQGKVKITNWAKMKKKMKGQFLPFGYTQTLFKRLHLLQQGSRSVDDYTEEFYQLIARNDLSETEEQMVARYLGGLRQPLQDVLSLHSLWTISEAYQCALIVEKQQNRRPIVRSDPSSRPVHPQESHPAQQPLQGPSPSHIRCFHCDEPEELGEPVYDDVEDEEVLYGDGHETLVVCKSLLTPKGDSGEDWLRTNVFHTTCTVADKVCKMIIDSGSCENVVSEEVVKKFVIHDGRKNTYSLSIKGKKIVLAPRREGSTPTPIDGPANLLSMSRFLVEIEKEDLVYALLPCGKSNTDMPPDLPVEVHQLLAEFSNLMPEDLPPGLPPMRDIQHQIDLVPGSSLPNRPAYRLSPKESEELQRQVIELLDRG
ncbi:uncharacterized protein [Aristolochia californica]|uniref:uncharacterized protein n=1 Tax=Aristolochia californica TaxID=171875 RepID=UPI0035D8E9B9